MGTLHESVLTRDYWLDLMQRIGATAAENGLKILLILFAYWAVRKLGFRIIDASMTRLLARQRRFGDSEDQANRLRTLTGLVKSVVGYLLLFILAVMLLDAVGANVSGLITTAGIGGLAFGFGAQKLVRDVISGFFLIVEDQFAVGDYVTIGAAVGVVQELGMRTTRIRDDQGRLWVLSNGDITVVVNHSRAPVEAYIEVGVAPTTDLTLAQRLIDEQGQLLFTEDSHALTAPPRSLGIANADSVHTLIRVAVVADPRALGTEALRVRTALCARLATEGITLA